MTRMEWYNSLMKPEWTPSGATIGLIWQILYPIILVTFGIIFVQAIRSDISWTVALPFASLLSHPPDLTVCSHGDLDASMHAFFRRPRLVPSGSDPGYASNQSVFFPLPQRDDCS